jgi:hypothetical protein
VTGTSSADHARLATHRSQPEHEAEPAASSDTGPKRHRAAAPPIATAGFAIRPTVLEDWPVLKAVRLAALAEAPMAFGVSLAEALANPDQQWRDRAAGKGAGRFFLAFSGAGTAARTGTGTGTGDAARTAAGTGAGAAAGTTAGTGNGTGTRAATGSGSGTGAAAGAAAGAGTAAATCTTAAIGNRTGTGTGAAAGATPAETTRADTCTGTGAPEAPPDGVATAQAGAEDASAHPEAAAVGMIAAVRTPDGKLNLIAMWVDPRWRGKRRKQAAVAVNTGAAEQRPHASVADVLIEAVKSHAVAVGADEILLEVAPDNAAAVSLYRRHGFCFQPHVEQLASHPHILLQRMGWVVPAPL